MATKTSNYEFNKPEQNDFYDVDVQNENWDKVDEELSEFDDSGVTEDIKSFPDFLSKFVTGNKVAITLRNLKAGLQFVLHAGQIVNNCVTDNAGLPLSAAQGKALMDKYTQLYSDSNRRFLIDKAIYNSLADLPSKGSCFGTIGNAPILINDLFSIPAYSRFAFINTGDSTDGALLAIDSNGTVYSAYRSDSVWGAGQISASKSDLTGIDAALSIREENGGVLVSFSSKDSKNGIYIGVGPNGVNANYKLNGEWKKAIIIATKS